MNVGSILDCWSSIFEVFVEVTMGVAWKAASESIGVTLVEFV